MRCVHPRVGVDGHNDAADAAGDEPDDRRRVLDGLVDGGKRRDRAWQPDGVQHLHYAHPDVDDDDVDDDDDDTDVTDPTNATDPTVVDDTDDAVAKVIAMIEDLPDPDKVTLDDYDAVYEAIEAYEDLGELGEGIDEALVEKLYADRIKVELLDLEDLISVSETLLSNYENLLSADMITEFQDKIDAANEVLNAEDPAIEDIWNAFDDLLFAMYQANDIIWVHYTIVEGENAVYITNSDTGIKFRIRQEGIHDWAYELFLDAGAVILIDGEELPEGAAKTSKGSLIIEIMPDFLKTLSVGEHKLTVKFDNDVTLDLVFTVRAATDVPASGESVSAAVYVGIAMVVLAAAGFVVNKRISKKES